MRRVLLQPLFLNGDGKEKELDDSKPGYLPSGRTF